MARLVDRMAAPRLLTLRDEDFDWSEVVATVHGQMRSIVGTSAELEDLTQAALEQVLRSSERFEGRAQLGTYTYRICVHVALNHWRWWRRFVRTFAAWNPAVPEPIAANQEPNHALDNARRTRSLHAALTRLAPAKRIAVTLVDLEELTPARVAEIMQCPEPTVRSRLASGRRELYTVLRDDPLFALEQTTEEAP
jgi:RNA polymerase sigma factor (sigma-70 family)